MWRRQKIHTDPVDVEIFRDGFLICEGSTLAFLDKEDVNNPFQRSLWIPVLYLFKVHRNHPLRVQSSELGHIYLYPDKEFKSPRMPGEVYENKMDWDITTFLMVPFTGGDFGTVWNKYEIPGGFTSDLGIVKDSTLIYINAGNMHTQDCLTILYVMPSQVVAYLNGWMYDGRNIISHDKTFDQKLEGRVSVPNQTRREILPKIAKTLERNYKTRLLFERY